MITFQTQCPHCQHIFAITQAQLALKDGLARCSFCKQIFSAKDNLITSATEANPALSTIDARDIPIITPPPATSATPTTPKIIDALFDDNRGVDEESDTLLTKKTDTRPVAFDIIDDFDTISTPVKSIPNTKLLDEQSPQTSKSSDESWIEELLKQDALQQQNQSYLNSSKINTPRNSSDISSLLEEFGVDTVTEKPLDQPEYQQRLNQRLEHKPTAQQIAQKSPLSRTLLWGIGSALLLLGLGLQYVIFNQESLLKDPNTASQLHDVCNSLHLPCNLAYADIKSVDTKVLSFEGKDNHADIILTLRNNATQSQIYPNLKITLQSNNTGVAQFIATPQQYLDDSGRTLLPQQIKPIKLRVNFPRNKADQVIVDPFY